MSKVLKALVVSGALGLSALTLPAVAEAAPVTFNGSFDVTANSTDPGLIVATEAITNPYSFTLDGVGSSQTLSLFKLWTDETQVNTNDKTPKPISVVLNFTLPYPGFGGTITGQTVGVLSEGVVTWTDPITVAFGAGGDGLLRIDLSDATFNQGSGGNLYPGVNQAAVIAATFTLLHEASDVPEPLTLSLLGTGLFGLGYLRRRQA